MVEVRHLSIRKDCSVLNKTEIFGSVQLGGRVKKMDFGRVAEVSVSFKN